MKAGTLKTFSELRLAVQIAVWLCAVSLFLRLNSLPALLRRLTIGGQGTRTTPPEIDRAVCIAVRVSQLRLFRFPPFPKPCVRQGLALFYALTRMGAPIELHFGVLKQGEELYGHCWVTLQGKPVAERTRTAVFTTIYLYPSQASLYQTNDSYSKEAL